ncbi:MAG: sel1 repeat family protein [Alphaproteobacteria bacterium]|nr:sel1 repeat family protein [Alphaproteobacteria bacterium]
MSNSQAARGASAAPRERPGGAAEAPYIDGGEPVETLPPLQEFGFEEPSPPPAPKPPPAAPPSPPSALPDAAPAPQRGLFARLRQAAPAETAPETGQEPPAPAVDAPPAGSRRLPGFLAALGTGAASGAAEPAAPPVNPAGPPATAPRTKSATGAAPARELPPAPGFLAGSGAAERSAGAAAPEAAAAAADSMPVSPEPSFAERLAPMLRRWRAAIPGARRSWMAIGAGAVVVVVLAGIVAAGIGPFARHRDYRAGTPPADPAQRFAYYQTGARAGDAEAELQLAILYAKGEGVTQDYAAAATWFRAAADQGVARAQYDLGVLYERGRGVKIDLAEAANWYLKAANGKFPLAEYNLAVCYTKGQGIRQDLPEAALWYRRAAGHGVVQAMINLGMMYEKGDGIAASPVDAYAWYLAAGQRNSDTAAQRAKDVYANLPRLDQIRAEALAADVAASIRNPESERAEAAPEKTDAKPNSH